MTVIGPRAVRVLWALAACLEWAQTEAAAPTSLAWRHDLTAARAEASATGRLLWLQFTGPWCANCRRMDAEAFSDHAVVKLAGRSFVPVKLRSDTHEDLVLGFGFSGLPATAIVRPSGEVVARLQGYRTPDAFTAFLRDAEGLVAPTSRSSRAASELSTVQSSGAVHPALDGFCPVALVDGHRLRRGSSGVTARQEGLLFWFEDESARETFRRWPARYRPVNGGECPVARVESGEPRPGSPRWGVLYAGHLYLCAGKFDRARFLANPARYARPDAAIRAECDHCWALDAALVADGLPRSVTRAGGVVTALRPYRTDAIGSRVGTLLR